MVLTDDVADHAGALLEARGWVELEQPHRVKQAPVDRFQAVAHIRQRPVHDGRQRIGQIALFQRVAQIDGFNVFRALRRRGVFAHDSDSIAEGGWRDSVQLLNL
jgi:hypothetical protein